MNFFIRIDLGHCLSSENHIVTIVTMFIYYRNAFTLHLIPKVIWQPILTIIGFVFSKSKTIILFLSERAGSIYVSLSSQGNCIFSLLASFRHTRCLIVSKSKPGIQESGNYQNPMNKMGNKEVGKEAKVSCFWSDNREGNQRRDTGIVQCDIYETQGYVIFISFKSSTLSL